jgi:hypothetical protein
MSKDIVQVGPLFRGSTNSVVDFYTQDDFRQLVVTAETVPTFSAACTSLKIAPKRSWAGEVRNSCLAIASRLSGSLFKTLAVLCSQQRCARIFRHTSSIAFQKPSAHRCIALAGTALRLFREMRLIENSGNIHP